MVIYLDVASGPCRAAWQVLSRLAESRPARLLVRHLPLADVHPLALPAAETLEAAAEQGRFFDVLDRLTATPPPDEAALLDVAAGRVEDPVRLRREVQQGMYRSRVVEDIGRATASGVRVIPELFVNGKHYEGLIRLEALDTALAAFD